MSGAVAPLIACRGLTRRFGEGARATEVLHGIDLDIAAGEFVAIVGQSGSGKSTLMNILGLLDRPTDGRYVFAGREMATLSTDARAALRRDAFGFVFQRYHLLPGLTALQNVELPALYAGVAAAERTERAHALLARLGLTGLAQRRPAELSGGQQQRVSIARALMNGGSVILADEPTGALDSATGAAVMDLLAEVAAEGRTVILITHDRTIAERADRTIRIADGMIVAAGTAAAPRPVPPPKRGSRRPGRVAVEIARSARRALAQNRVRTALTLVGIVIGGASVIAMLAIGEGTRHSVMAQASATGTDWIVVMPDGDNPGQPGGRMTLADAEALAALPNVRHANPGRWSPVTLTSPAATVRSEAFATSALYPETFRWETEYGAFFTAADDRAAAPVAVLGATVAEALYPGPADPVGTDILLNNIPFTVIGVLEAKGPDERGMDRDDRVVIPFLTGATRLSGDTDLGGIQVTVADTSRMAETKALVEETLLARHRMRDFFINDMAQRIASLAATQSSLSLLLALIAAISLVVGGIGVMNVMLMSVTERTREIGIRMAVGASRTDILGQFLSEAVLISGVGGAVGLALGLAIGIGAALLLGVTVIFEVSAVALALAVATGMGLVFGFMPARRAARLDPVRALAAE
ncbi:ABC transporter permease [Acuticoccus mangrovi]|uniref:Pyoverdine export ATP-binding/permease protein PvdT n=1 Tax=Acuticoccus mangrovi TaxID=2796142 RepID=A0A934IUD5_9HYPH|nr:ABC transporter permease [Acuticoccus mangrovi]MBJ3778763.1 ABC transporter permease [Acuticoccus mangrovi]